MTTGNNEPSVLRQDEEGVTTLTLNRPRQFNALSEEMLTALQGELENITSNDTVRMIILAANGKTFCADHGLKQMRANPEEGYYQDLFAQCGNLMYSIMHQPQPVIARVHGIATAAGCQLPPVTWLSPPKRPDLPYQASISDFSAAHPVSLWPGTLVENVLLKCS